jgi:hypothetical protein
MEKRWKDFRRTPNIGQGRWKNTEKISNELLKSARVDGKMLKRFQTNF